MAKSEKKAVIEFKNVMFGYTPTMLNINDVSFNIYEGEYVCVIGHNGSGKSTISKIMTGLLNIRGGKVNVYGNEIDSNNTKNIRNNIGIIFQNPDNQFVGLTVSDDIAFGLENHRVPQEKMDDIINLVAKSTGVSDLLNKSPNELSGGQKQRVAIAGIIACNPKIIIFDESTSMLDPNAKQDLKKLMLFLKNQYGKTIISVTHDMEEVTECDRVLIMNGGKLLKSGSPKEIFEDRKFLQSIKLDVPFSLQVCLEMAEVTGHEFPLSLKLNDVVNNLCSQKK
ncbi:MAG: energy-coupling factor transporter ATPase [Mycoplasmataceae bacterium]|jgi:energy-coupling factor transport system ATP-binding protein|nr:energy-coupling factor transporter ATPase [Mycoplasmataceae bacterium]